MVRRVTTSRRGCTAKVRRNAAAPAVRARPRLYANADRTAKGPGAMVLLRKPATAALKGVARVERATVRVRWKNCAAPRGVPKVAVRTVKVRREIVRADRRARSRDARTETVRPKLLPSAKRRWPLP